MEKPRLQDSYDPITLSDIAGFEATMNVTLPGDYREFLLEHNGGNFPRSVSTSRDERDPRYTLVEAFYGLVTGDDSDLVEITDLLQGDLPPDFIAIGDDGMGNFICLAISGQDLNSVWFRDHEEPIDHNWPPKGMIRLSDSFADFFKELRYDPARYDPLKAREWSETSPQFMAIERGEISKLAELLEQGIGIDSRNADGQTMLICAASARQSQIVQLLIERGVDLHARDDQGRTALFAAAESYSLDSAKALVEAGASLESEDIDGNTPLLIGMEVDTRVPLYLINRGANVNHRNQAGDCPLSACDLFEDELREPLLEAGAHE